MDTHEDQVMELLRSPSPRKRVVGLVHAARRRLTSAVSLATAALTDTDDDVRSAAAWALDVIGDPAAMPALVAAMYDDVFSVRSSAGWALVHMGQAGRTPEVVSQMDDVLRSAMNPNAREMARLVLVYLGGPEATETLDAVPTQPVLH